jgi:hypothetical protein
MPSTRRFRCAARADDRTNRMSKSMSISTSRRNVLTKAAALPILAMPAVTVAGVAEASPQSDPIFAAIQACIEAERADAAALDRLNEAEVRFEDEYGAPEPDAISKDLRQLWREQADLENLAEGKCASHEVVDRFMDSLARGQSAAKDFDEEKWADTRAYLHEELDRQTAAFNKTVIPMKEAAEAASQRFREATVTLIETEPTTLAGLAAIFACLRDHQSLREYVVCDFGDSSTLIDTLSAATARFATLV